MGEYKYRTKKQKIALSDYFADDFIKIAAEQPAPQQDQMLQEAAMQQEAPMPQQHQAPATAMQQGLTSSQVDPMTGLPLNGPQPTPIPQTNDIRQAGLPATGIVCNSDCIYAQNMKGMCSLNKINFTQVKQGVFECENYEPIMTEGYVG